MPIIFVAHDYWPICGQRCFIDPYKAEKKEVCLKTGIVKCVFCIGARPYLKTKRIQKLMKKVTRGISPTLKTCRIYEKHGVLTGKWSIVLPWINLEVFASGKKIKRNKDVLFVGSLLDYKGAMVIARAFPIILKKVPKSKLIYIGAFQGKKSIFRKKIEDLAKEEGITDKIKFLKGKRSEEIAEYQKKCGVYVCPPIWPELFGLNWAEAMASGCPVVASDIGGIPEFIVHTDKGINGLLFKPRNHKELAQKVIKILQDENLSRKISENGAKYAAKHFDIRNNMKEIIRVYKDAGVDIES